MGKQPRWLTAAGIAAAGVMAAAGVAAAAAITTDDHAPVTRQDDKRALTQPAPADEAEPGAAVPSMTPRADAIAARPSTRKVSLILDYTVAKTCAVHPNYPKDGVLGNDIGWQIGPSDVVAWRYNVNSTWSVISDRKYRNSKHPWWGFVHRDCIGKSIGGEHFPTPASSYPADRPVPKRLLQGRSGVAADHYRKVDFQPAAAHVVNDHRVVRSMGTLRDAANRFVIGNVFAGWHVRTTNQHNAGWTKVYVPNAKRWGWVQDIHL